METFGRGPRRGQRPAPNENQRKKDSVARSQLNPSANLQTQRNTESVDGWQTFAGHRAQVMSLLLKLAGDASDPVPRRICLLGAGNCNDIDLPQLIHHFAEVHLVDLDRDALIAGTRTQGVAESEQIKLHVGMDLSGIVEQLGQWHTTPPRPGDYPAVVANARSATIPIAGPFDVVASLCTISQLIDAVLIASGQPTQESITLALAVRDRHLELMEQLTQPGGHLVLITDVTSSATVPDLNVIPVEQLPVKLIEMINTRNFFTGLNPFALLARYRQDPEWESRAESAELSAPWIWNLGPRQYIVCALTVRKPVH